MTSTSSIERLYTIWEQVSGIQLDEQDYMTLSYELAIRLPELRDYICTTQLSRITNRDRRAQYEYISRATVADTAERDALFEWLLNEPQNRRPEPWAASMLGYLCHHTRQQESLPYIYKGLEALTEIQRTGDIFFPRNWVGALLGGHYSEEAEAEVKRFFEDNPDYSPLLRNKILQACN
jgi:aminopeptidase N